MKRQRLLSDHHQRKYKERDFSDLLRQSLEWNFNKVFTYIIPEEDRCTLELDDLFSEEAWQDEELLAIKVRLNAVKSELSDKDIKVWHSHTCNMNPTGLVVSRVRELGKPELCTQAWCKFHEILSTFTLVEDFNDEDGNLRTLHLCEAPGAFITSLNHYMKTRGVYCNWQWVANTLNPHYEGNGTQDMIADDKFILQTQANWYFGPDNTGDIMSAVNMRSLQETYSTSKCHLITADGSIDCANNPSEQESMTSMLHYCELVTALSVLNVGGHLVLKMFTLLENRAVGMMYLISTLFKQVTVFKPASSKPGNSEVYLVCQSFNGIREEVLEKLLLNTEFSTKSIFPEATIPKSFRSQHLSCCQLFANYQMKTIERNQMSFRKRATETSCDLDQDVVLDRDTLETEKECCVQMYLDKCQIETIHWSDKLVVRKRKQILKDRSFSEPPHKRKLEGSFMHRQEFKHLAWQQRVSAMELFEVDPVTGPFHLKSCKKASTCVDLSEWTVVRGKTLDRVKSSRFCTDQLLSLYTTFLQHQQHQVNQVVCIEDAVLEYLCRFVCTQESDVPSLQLIGDVCPFVAELKQCLDNKGVRLSVNPSDSHTRNSYRLHVVSCPQDTTEEALLVDQRVFGRCLHVVLEELQRGDCLLLHTVVPLTRLYTGLIYTLHLLFNTVKVITTQTTVFPSVYICCDDFVFDRGNQSSMVLPSNTDLSMEVSKTVEEGFYDRSGSGVVPDLSRSCQNQFKEGVDLASRDRTNLKNSSKRGQNASDLIGYLRDIYTQWLDSRQGNKTQLLEFVPMLRLYDSDFFENFLWLNDNLIMQRMNRLMTQHKEQLKL